MWNIPSPPEASSSPFGLKRTTLTAFVCLARLDRNSTAAFPSASVSTRHNCGIKPKIHHTAIGDEKYNCIEMCNLIDNLTLLDLRWITVTHFTLESSSLPATINHCCLSPDWTPQVGPYLSPILTSLHWLSLHFKLPLIYF